MTRRPPSWYNAAMEHLKYLLSFCLLLGCLGLYGQAETLETILAEPYFIGGKRPVAGFLPYGGTWTLEKNVVVAPQGSGYRLAYADYSGENTEFSAEIYVEKDSPGNAAIVTNGGNDGVGADAFDGYEWALCQGAVMLGRHQQNFKSLLYRPFPIPENAWVRVTARCTRRAEGNWLEFLVNGTRAAEFLDPDPLPAGRVALRPWQRTVRYRNLVLNGKPIPLEPDLPREAPYPETLRTETLPPILVVGHGLFRAPPAVGQDFWAAKEKTPGCSLKILYPAEPKQAVETIFSDPHGVIYDANLSLDARTVFFSYRPAGEKYWHVYRIGIDGTGLKALTSGEQYDFGPAELPSGEIVFVSSRKGGYTVCQPGPTSNLYKMNADGSDVRCLSMNTLSDFHPQVLPDGRILFTRWEYIDRDLTYRQSLWTENPDGTNYQLYFGNTVRNCGSFLQSRPIPGRSDLVVSTFTSHHGYPHGAIGLIHRNRGIEGGYNIGYEYLTPELFPIGDSRQEWAYRDPFPLSEERFLCAYGSERNGRRQYRIYLLNREGEKRLLYEDPNPDMGAYSPIAVRPVPMPAKIPSQLEPTPEEKPVGRLLLVNVYEGLFPFVRPGEAAKIRILEQVRKSEDLRSRAFDQSPVMSYATYYAKRCWGEVPIEKDGSAYFEVPALREIYLQVLDSEGRELQRMTSALQVMPGQTQSCTGCHEYRESAPLVLKNQVQPLAAGREASVPKLPDWWKEIAPTNAKLDTRTLNYTTLVQPVWDKYCVTCHSGLNPDGGYDLSGDKTRFFSMSYDNLLGRSRSYRQYNMQTGRILPEEAAREKPLVQFYWLLWTPSGVSQPLEAGILASRLESYLSKAHCGREMTQADRQRVFLWVDANVPYYPTYAVSRPDTPGQRDLWAGAWFQNDYMEVYQRRCFACHQAPEQNDTPTGMPQKTTCWNGRFAWLNLSHPERSPALVAHRPKPLGRGISTQTDSEVFLFERDSDPDYQKMLRAIQEGNRAMLALPRADMPGFGGAKEEY
ncbi:MAG: hypothetical protein Q4D98_09705 [Planctomycetia bacterium]|nr:hypothetical protein [Planctomycetia bacterium]